MKTYKILFILCIIWFIVLCLLHYFSSRPLWIDENFVLENIKNLNSKQILGPLGNCQYFPRIYLLLIKLFSQKFNYQVLSLRFFPLIAMISAFLVWLKIYKKELLSRWQYLLILFSFASVYYMSYYAAEFKHYSMDLLTVGLFCLYFYHQKELINNNKPLNSGFVIVTLLLPLTILFSYSSFFVFWTVIYNFLFIKRKNLKFIATLAGYIITCSLVMAFVYWIDLRHTFGAKVTFSYWHDYFLCTDSAYCFFKSFGEGLRKMVVWWFGDSTLLKRVGSILIPFFFFSLISHGFKSIKKYGFKFFGLDTLGLILFLELFILGILNKYPFTGARTSLFFAPFVFYFIVKSFEVFNRKLYITANILYFLFIIVCGLSSFLTYIKLYD